MPELKYLDEVICIVQKALVVGVMHIDYYEVSIKDSGTLGRLLCSKVPPLRVGQEFVAQLIEINFDGTYLLQNPMYELNSDGKYVLKPEFQPPSIPGGGKLVPFPKRPTET
ncbi:MAG: hypothetical protein U0103_29310 [Candidatus Obscuribacterales bacterium]